MRCRVAGTPGEDQQAASPLTGRTELADITGSRGPLSVGAELDGFDEQEQYGDDQVAAQGEDAELECG
jgi:hypothetical protein